MCSYHFEYSYFSNKKSSHFQDEEDSIALIFQNVTPDDAGLYTCVASSTHGKISCSAELTVQGWSLEATNVIRWVRIFSFHWILPGAVKQVKKQLEKPVVECFCHNYESQIAGMSIIEVKATGNPTPNIQWWEFELNNALIFSFQVALFHNIKFRRVPKRFKGDEEIKSGDHYELEYDATTGKAVLKIKNVDSKDIGEYRVVATNEIGSDSQRVNVNVKG